MYVILLQSKIISACADTLYGKKTTCGLDRVLRKTACSFWKGSAGHRRSRFQNGAAQRNLNQNNWMSAS
jgi:hypothetical protein